LTPHEFFEDILDNRIHIAQDMHQHIANIIHEDFSQFFSSKIIAVDPNIAEGLS